MAFVARTKKQYNYVIHVRSLVIFKIGVDLTFVQGRDCYFVENVVF